MALASARRKAAWWLALAALVGCEPTAPAVSPRARPTAPPPVVASAPPPPAPAPSETPDADFRKAAPKPGPEVKFTPPTIGEARLGNGIRVLMVERHEMPIVALQVVATRGSSQAQPGVGAFAGAMLLAGTKNRSALDLSDAFSGLGAQQWSYGDYDSAGVGVQVLSSKLGAALELVAEVVREPSFSRDELLLERSRRLTSLAQERDSPARLAQRLVAETLYPKPHPYHSTLLGDEKAIEKISSADLGLFHRAQFQPDRLTVVAAGDFSRESLLSALENSLGKLHGKAEKPRDIQAPPPPGRDATRVLVVDRPGASQSNVAIAMVGVPRKTSDFLALMVMNTILGGQFSSRINLNLREKHGYTYGAGSGFAMRQGPGPFTVSGAIVSEHTAAAIKEIFAEIEALRSAPVSDDELADAKAYLIRRMPALFESAGDTASTLASMAVYDLPLDEFAQRPALLERISKDDIKRVANQHLKPDTMRVVLVGDAEKVRPSLEALKLGKVEVRKPPAKKDSAQTSKKDAARKDEPKKK